MKILHDCYQNHESASFLLTIILIFGFLQCLMYFQPHTMSGIGLPENPTMVDIKIMLFCPFCHGNLYSLTLQKWRPSWILLTNAMTKIISGHTIMSGIPVNHTRKPYIDTKIMNQFIFYRKLYQLNI